MADKNYFRPFWQLDEYLQPQDNRFDKRERAELVSLLVSG